MVSTATSTSVVFTGPAANKRWCSTSTMLPPASPITAVTSLSDPGRSSSHTRSRHRLGAAAEREHHRRVVLRLHADELDVGGQRFGHDARSCEQTAAADGHDEDIERGCVLEHLQRDRPLAGDDERIVEGMDEGPP